MGLNCRANGHQCYLEVSLPSRSAQVCYTSYLIVHIKLFSLPLVHVFGLPCCRSTNYHESWGYEHGEIASISQRKVVDETHWFLLQSNSLTVQVLLVGLLHSLPGSFAMHMLPEHTLQASTMMFTSTRREKSCLTRGTKNSPIQTSTEMIVSLLIHPPKCFLG